MINVTSVLHPLAGGGGIVVVAIVVDVKVVLAVLLVVVLAVVAAIDVVAVVVAVVVADVVGAVLAALVEYEAVDPRIVVFVSMFVPAAAANTTIPTIKRISIGVMRAMHCANHSRYKAFAGAHSEIRTHALKGNPRHQYCDCVSGPFQTA